MTISSVATGSQTGASHDTLISSDSHVIEDPDLWVNRLPARFRDQAPRFPPRRVGADFQAHPGGWDPAERLSEMAADGVSAEVLYPTSGLTLYSIKDAPLQQACFEAYNDWLMEYCQVAPNRLVGVPMISLYDIDHAIEELERCRRGGLKGALVWQVAHPDLPFTSRHYDRFWAAAQDMAMPVSFHILTGFGWSKDGFAKLSWVDGVRGASLGEVVEAANVLYDLILTGVLERHPRLKLVLVESEIGWLPFILEKMDQKALKVRRDAESSPLTRPPSEYFMRQVYASFFNDPIGGKLLSFWGQDNCMWSNDYPHPNSTWPHSRDVIARQLGTLSADAQAKLTWRNVAELYELEVPHARQH